MKKKHKHHKNPQIQAKCADFWGERMKKKKKNSNSNSNKCAVHALKNSMWNRSDCSRNSKMCWIV